MSDEKMTQVFYFSHLVIKDNDFFEWTISLFWKILL